MTHSDITGGLPAIAFSAAGWANFLDLDGDHHLTVQVVTAIDAARRHPFDGDGSPAAAGDGSRSWTRAINTDTHLTYLPGDPVTVTAISTRSY